MRIYRDRMTVRELADCDPLVLKLLRQAGKGKTDRKEHVHFCGMLISPDVGTVVFVPLCADNSIATCKDTMKVLARYGSDNPRRVFEDEAVVGNVDLISIIFKLAQDFRDNGIYAERTRQRARDTGKPNWPQTIKRVRPFLSYEGEAIYSNISTIRSVDSRETLLGQVHSFVISEIYRQHGWWLDGLAGRESELRSVSRPTAPRRLWSKLLSGFLTSVYSARGIRLAQLLIEYLEQDTKHAIGSHAFGLEDFHSVWEHMLASTVPNVIDGINSDLPHASYIPNPNWVGLQAVSRRMRTDIIAKIGEGYALLDAKYYAAHGPDSLPGWGDIAKQIVYEQALRHIVGEPAEILNAFIFPREAGSKDRYIEINMKTPNSQEKIASFPSLKLVAVDVQDVMATYIARGKIALFESSNFL